MTRHNFEGALRALLGFAGRLSCQPASAYLNLVPEQPAAIQSIIRPSSGFGILVSPFGRGR
jgi:hypothetical protein